MGLIVKSLTMIDKKPDVVMVSQDRSRVFMSDGTNLNVSTYIDEFGEEVVDPAEANSVIAGNSHIGYYHILLSVFEEVTYH